jgi:hypothetical protein
MYCVIREKGDVYNALRSISGRRKSVWDEIKQNRTAIVRFFCGAPGMGGSYRVKVPNGGWLYQPLA